MADPLDPQDLAGLLDALGLPSHDIRLSITGPTVVPDAPEDAGPRALTLPQAQTFLSSPTPPPPLTAASLATRLEALGLPSGDLPRPPVPPEPLQALQRAATIGPSQPGERYLPQTLGEIGASAQPLLAAIRRLADPLVGAGRPASVAAVDPYGIEAWQRTGQAPPGLMMGSVEPVAAAPSALTRLAPRYPALAKALTTAGEDHVALQGSGSLVGALDRAAKTIYSGTLTDGGVSLQPFTNQQPVAPGVMAGKFANQTGQAVPIPVADFTPAKVRAFFEQHANTLVQDPSLYVGGWLERDAAGAPQTVWLDVSQQHPTPRQAVVAASKQRQPAGQVRDPVTGAWPMPQKAVWDLAGHEVPVGNFAEFVGSPAFQQRLDDMYAVGDKVMNGKDWWNLYGSDLERVYGKDRVAPLAGFLASTSPASAPVHNLRSASEYLRRLIAGEPIIQPDFRVPATAVGSLKTSMGAMAPGDFNRPGTRMPMEATRAPNLLKAASGQYAQLGQDKVNDMFHALTGMDVGVFDRRYAKLAEDWDRGLYAESQKDKLIGSMETGKVSSYALVENALRDGAKRYQMPLSKFSATVWEGIGETIKRTGQLYGMKQQAHSIPEASLGFPGIFGKMVEEKAAAWGISVAELERRLRSGNAELLSALIATPVGTALYRRYLAQHPPPPAAGAPSS